MKRAVVFLSLIFVAHMANAQEPLFVRVSALLKESLPAASIDHKLIAVTFWRMSDRDSREKNSAFNKAAGIYEFAKLKGGSRGLVVVAVSVDNTELQPELELKKEGNGKLVALNKSALETLYASGRNAVFDEKGNLVYSNLEAQAITDAINRLITR